MSLDSEAEELIKRLVDIEDRLISDKVVEESLYTAIRTLELIFGKRTAFSDLIKKLKSIHKVKRLDSAVKRAISKTKTSIKYAKASAIFPFVDVNKNSILAEFLEHKSKISIQKLRQFREFFTKNGSNLEEAFEKGDSEQIKRMLRKYIEMLEAEEEFLRENANEMTKDISVAWSLHNGMIHEVAHWAFIELTRLRNIYAMSVNEAYSFSLQKFVHTYSKDYVFTTNGLIFEIAQFYKFIIPRKFAYSPKQYIFMKPFIILIGILILSDSVARKENNYQNKKLLLESYSKTSFIKLYNLIEQAIENIKNEEFKKIIRDKLLKTTLSQLKKNKDIVLNDIKHYLKELPKLEHKPYLTLGKGYSKVNWENFKDAVIVISSNSVRQIASALDLLRLMGFNNEANNYRNQYLKILEETLEKVVKQTKDKESRIYSNEKDVISGLISIIKEEEEDLAEIISQLKS